MPSLIEIKTHLSRVKVTTLSELARIFQSEPKLIQALVEHWIRKGRVCRKTKATNCRTRCRQCPPHEVEQYEWI